MREAVDCLIVRCDRCGEAFENGDGVTLHWPRNESNLIDLFDWYVWDEYEWCDGCGPPACTCSHGFAEHENGDADCELCDCETFDWKPTRSGEDA